MESDPPWGKNTIVVLTSDHGWGMGEKDYLYKNSLWQESTRVPLIIKAPGVSQIGQECRDPVSLIDVYPTLLDLCQLPTNTRKNEKGHDLDGHSLKPLLKNPANGQWSGPSSALTALYKWRTKYEPSKESYSLRSRDFRYIRYENGKEELYDTRVDPLEWKNVAASDEYSDTVSRFRQEIASRIPRPEDVVPAQPPFQPKRNAQNAKGGNSKPLKKDSSDELSANAWKSKYFVKHPDADTNGDGKLTWAEYQTYRKKYDPVPSSQ